MKRYDYYRLTLPSDLVQLSDWTEWAAQMFDRAIDAARDTARLWCVPCEWQAELLEGGPDTFESVFRVRRKRYAK
jgi:hypothetical protein